MSQEKAQLIAPLDSTFTVPGVTVSGVITATSFDGTNSTGVADSITQGNNLNVGVVTALSFAGNLTGNAGGLTGSPNTTAGVVTATSFVGDLTGNATSLTGSPNLNLGVTTASSFVGAVTGNVVGNVTGDALSATVTGVTTSNNINVGVVTSSDFRGDGSNLTGAEKVEVTAQDVTADSATTTINLSSGNLIYMSQSADTTVSLANTSNGTVYIVRTKDDTATERSITWPNSINWNGGVTPTLLSFDDAADYQIFQLITRDEGVTWYAEQVYEYSTIMESTGTAWAWGHNESGQLGLNQGDDSPTQNFSSPTQIGTESSWSVITANNGSTSAIKNDGTLWTWGKNFYGQLGLNQKGGPAAVGPISSPTQVGTDTTWSNVSFACMSANHIMATKTDGTLWCWGSNQRGQCGQNSKTPNNSGLSSPTQVGTDTTWTDKISSGWEQSYAIKTDGTLWGWGFNESPNASLGIPGNVDRSSPTAIGTETDWVFVNAGTYVAGAIRNTDELFVWGDNDYGQLGVNNRTRYTSPQQIPGAWQSVSMSKDISAYAGGGGIKADGTLWKWGTNGGGALGQGGDVSPDSQNVYRSSPVQVGTDTNWNQMDHDYASNLATKTDGTLWGWGNNPQSQLGLNNRTQYNSPKQVGTDTNWTTNNSKHQLHVNQGSFVLRRGAST